MRFSARVRPRVGSGSTPKPRLAALSATTQSTCRPETSGDGDRRVDASSNASGFPLSPPSPRCPSPERVVGRESELGTICGNVGCFSSCFERRQRNRELLAESRGKRSEVPLRQVRPPRWHESGHAWAARPVRLARSLVRVAGKKAFASAIATRRPTRLHRQIRAPVLQLETVKRQPLLRRIPPLHGSHTSTELLSDSLPGVQSHPRRKS